MSDILRWVCDQYRKKLLEVDPLACREVDIVMAKAGQHWITHDDVIDPNKLVTSRDVELMYGISDFQVQYLARTYAIEVRGKRGKFRLYRLGDVLSARAGKLPKK